MHPSISLAGYNKVVEILLVGLCCLAQCLLTLTEDNGTAITWLCEHTENLSLLESLLPSDSYTIGTITLVRALVVGK